MNLRTVKCARSLCVTLFIIIPVLNDSMKKVLLSSPSL